jgi:hypothetical protein
MATGDGIFSSILGLLRTPVGEAAVRAGVAAFGGSDGSGGSGSVGGKGFVPQENPVLKAARTQAFADITRSATSQERSQRGPIPRNTASDHLMSNLYSTRPRALASMYNNIQSYAASPTPRVVHKTRG